MTAAVTANPRAEERIPLARLVKIEIRKAVDTRSGFWFAMVILALTALVLVLSAAGAFEATTNGELFNHAFAPTAALLPIVSILLVTSEFSQRTALTTFVLVPNRWRVIGAKLIGILVVVLGMIAAVLLLSILAHAISPDAIDTPAGGVALWDGISQNAVGTSVAVMSAFGFGLVLRNTPAAIVSYILVPTFVSAALYFTPGLEDAEPWIGTGALDKLGSDETLNSTEWAQVASASAIWLLLPLLLGLWRLRRAEIK